MSARSTSKPARASEVIAQAALFGVALLASGCVNDLGVGLSRISPDDESPDDQSPDDDDAPEGDSGSASSDAGARDAGFDAGRDAGADAAARNDAQAPLDAAAGDAGTRPRDASAPDTGRVDACAQSGARDCGDEPDAGAPEPCLKYECETVMFTPALTSESDICESGSMDCRRDDGGVCRWYCIPPFTAQGSEDTVISLEGDAAVGDAATREGGARLSDTEVQSDAGSPSDAAENDAAGPSAPTAQSDASL